jgi:hypothetical protein
LLPSDDRSPPISHRVHLSACWCALRTPWEESRDSGSVISWSTERMPASARCAILVPCARSKEVVYCLFHLALAGGFSNGQISSQDEDMLQAAVASLGLGYRLGFIPTPGSGYHYTCAVIYGATGTMLHALPLDAAQAIGNAFLRMPNPHRRRRP